MRIRPIFLFLIVACSINVNQIPDPPVARNPLPSCDAPLYLGRFEVNSTNSDHAYEQMLKKSLSYYLAARRAFPVISELPDNAERLPSEFLILDGDVFIAYDDEYNWWITWPAVYPMIGYWPFQQRKGRITVEATFTVAGKDGQTRQRFTSTKQASQELLIYGFFRTSAMESIIRQNIAEVMRDTARQVAQRAQEHCPRGGKQQ